MKISDILFQIILAIAGMLIGVFGQLLSKLWLKISSLILAIILLIVASLWIGYEWGNKNSHLALDPTIEYQLTLLDTYSKNGCNNTPECVGTKEKEPTNTITPTIYDPIIESMLVYFDHLPNNNRPETSIDYDSAWDILDPTLQIRYRSCDGCQDAKEQWIYYVSQYYWNITPSDLRLSGAIIIYGSYAKADLEVEKIRIKGSALQYRSKISYCLTKGPKKWMITHVPEALLPTIDSCLEY